MRKIRYTIVFALVAFAAVFELGNETAFGQEEKEHFVAVRAGRVITVSGDEIEDGVIVIRNGKIEAIGENVEVPWGAEIIDVGDAVVMPGLVNPWTRYGLRAYSRSGSHADLTAIAELFPGKDTFKELRESGFTTVGLIPEGNGLPGQASAIRPVPGTAEEITVSQACFVRIPFDNPSRDKKILRDTLKKAKAEIDKLEAARKKWEEEQKKKAEEEKKKAEEEKKKKEEKGEKDPDKDKKEPEKEPSGKEKESKDEKKEPEEFKPPKMDEALVPLVDLIQKKEGARSLIELGGAEGYLHVEQILEEFEIPHAYQVQNFKRARFSDFGGVNDTDAGLISEQMGEKKALVLLFPEINTVPYTADLVHLPAEFTRAGCQVAFAPAMASRSAFENYRTQVSELVKWGLSREDALKGMTLYPARLLGLDERLGTLEEGRDANLIVLDGDPFDPQSRVTKVMIEGKIVAEPKSRS